MRNQTKLFTSALAVSALFVASARADWNPGDPYKMHFPQLPDPFGWDVSVNTVSPPPPAAVADDWRCTDTGPVSDIHIWFSMRMDQNPIPSLMAFTIWSDIPAVGTNYSRPGALLWNHVFSPADYTIRLYGTGDQGWLDPNNHIVAPADHFMIWQLNLTLNPAVIPFVQQAGSNYWLGVNFEPLWGDAGWKTSLNHFNDDAVWWDFQTGMWQELRDPLTGQSLDMAFVITTIPEPGTAALLHQSNSSLSIGVPRVSGATQGVSGIDFSGQAVKFGLNQYEICFKCHGDNNFVATPPITRQIDQLNTRLEFSQANPSFHPVTAPRNNPNVPSLLPPYTSASVILCTDCHSSDDAFGPKGPHGSMNRYLLAKNYTTAENTTESPVAYALCYSCHSRASLLSDQSFKRHQQHIVDIKAPCSSCHDAHGISNTQGNPVNNAHLINFDLAIVQPDSNGRLSYEKTGMFRGTCYLSCHGRNNNPRNY